MILSIRKLKLENQVLNKKIADLKFKIRKLEISQISNIKKINVLRKKKDALKNHVRLQNEKIGKLEKIKASNNIKIESLKMIRDYNHDCLIDYSNNTSAIDFNKKDSMDDYYSHDTNVEKYFSAIQDSVYDLFFNLLKKKFPSLNVLKTLDAGCGLGVFTNRLKNRLNGEVLGCDFSSTAIRKAQKKFPEILFFRHDLYQPLEQYYSLIVCTETLEHLLTPEKVVANLLRALTRRDSILFMTVPDGRLDSSKKHINFWSPESWSSFVKQWHDDYHTQIGIMQHPKKAYLRYNWAILTPKIEL